VPEVGIEPTLGFPNQILSLARLPVSPLRLNLQSYRKRTLCSSPLLWPLLLSVLRGSCGIMSGYAEK
jgi:hypothetical protein